VSAAVVKDGDEDVLRKTLQSKFPESVTYPMYLLVSRNKKRLKFSDLLAILKNFPRANTTDNAGAISFHIVHWMMKVFVYTVSEV
jgi:hypothetical protein